jgi:hypothetical protein
MTLSIQRSHFSIQSYTTYKIISDSGNPDDHDDEIDECHGDIFLYETNLGEHDVNDLESVTNVEFSNDLIEQEESWDLCMKKARDEFRNVVIMETEKIPQRLKGYLIIWFDNNDNEWDLMEVESSSPSSIDHYRLHSLRGSKTFIVHRTKFSHGKDKKVFVVLKVNE